MSMTALHPRRLFLFGMLSLLDLALTYKLVQASGGHIYESNPIANEWLSRFGWPGLAAFKVMAVSVVASAAIYVSVYRPRAGSRLLNFACLTVSLVVIYSFSLSNVVGKGLTMDAWLAEPIVLGPTTEAKLWSRVRDDKRLVNLPPLSTDLQGNCYHREFILKRDDCTFPPCRRQMSLNNRINESKSNERDYQAESPGAKASLPSAGEALQGPGEEATDGP